MRHELANFSNRLRQRAYNPKMRVSIAFALMCFSVGCSRLEVGQKATWNKTAAASYLDQRETRWTKWAPAARDQDTFCVSCHTVVPYALSRRALDSALNQPSPTPEERELIENVTKRVRSWDSVEPYYKSQAAASRGTEAVLNALILANNDAGRGYLSADTLTAFDEMWKLQASTGAESGGWDWIGFDNEPWEAYDSAYYGATLAAIAVSMAPGDYRDVPGIQANLRLLRDYLRRNYRKQTLLNRTSLLWASMGIPDLLDAQEKQSLVGEILSRQRSDGGWCVSTLVGTWKRRDGTPLPKDSDGYATGFVTYVLELAGVRSDDIRLKNGLSWLVRNQGWWDGNWKGYSLNKRYYDPRSNAFYFMRDAATSYAVLALTGTKVPSSETPRQLGTGNPGNTEFARMTSR
jgi:squalene-hopene/tetraprenyl-beta-curcumene cyclase